MPIPNRHALAFAHRQTPRPLTSGGTHGPFACPARRRRRSGQAHRPPHRHRRPEGGAGQRRRRLLRHADARHVPVRHLSGGRAARRAAGLRLLGAAAALSAGDRLCPGRAAGRARALRIEPAARGRPARLRRARLRRAGIVLDRRDHRARPAADGHFRALDRGRQRALRRRIRLRDARLDRRLCARRADHAKPAGA